jgi:hypothetical protein
MIRFASFILSISLTSTIAFTLLAQTDGGNGGMATVEGVVVDNVTGQPVEGIHVAILEGAQPLSEEGILALISDQL